MGIFSAIKSKRSGSSSSNNSSSNLSQVSYNLQSSESFAATMSSTASQSTSESRPSSRHHHDTGFPESFATCTTSMRHPDAIIDPGFAMSAEHIDPARSFNRSRTSLLRKHRRTISYGKLTKEELAAHAMASDANMPSALVSLSSSDRADVLAEQEPNGVSTVGTAQDSSVSTADQARSSDLNDGEDRRRVMAVKK
ncbi:hypothetical protein GGS20DRAFT_588399 [Poronia punctata]|nr:hypothetical protein GGS20DRAFT_588399 [Poronia punctata]